jgi:arginase family enzyme
MTPSLYSPLILHDREPNVSTRVIVFPFDLFGAGGSASGAELLADELREILADNRRETVVTRARSYTRRVRIAQASFETVEDYQKWREEGRQLAKEGLDEDFLIWITGNHLGCLPVYDVLAAMDDPPLVVQFDAHLDIHQFAGYSPEPSHGNFLLHCNGPLPPLVNIGHRELLLTQEDIHKHYRAAIPATERRLPMELAAQASSILIDLDCDVFDPAYFPAVSRPVPFGLSPREVLEAIEALWSQRVRGILLSEFDPARDEQDRSLATLAWLIEYLLLNRYAA